MSVLDKQIGPFPVKVWAIIGVTGVVLGIIVAKRNAGTSSSSGTTPDATTAALANLSTRLNASNQDSQGLQRQYESITSQYATDNAGLQEQIARIQNTLSGVLAQQPTTQPVQPAYNPYTYVRFPQYEDGSGNQVFVRYENPQPPRTRTTGITSTV